MNTIIKLKSYEDVPKYYTGIVEWDNGDREWRKEGGFHRTDGPAIEWVNGRKEWWVDSIVFNAYWLEHLIKTAIYLGTEKGKYNLYWLKFLTERGIKEFAVIPGMKEQKDFEELFEILDKEIKTATSP